MKKYIVFALISIVSFVGCYEDKGNYTYTDINELEIAEFPNNGASLTAGEEILIEPKLMFLNGSTDESHLQFQWNLNGVDVEDQKNRTFRYTPTELGRLNILLKVKDTKNGMTYLRQVGYTVKSTYDASGWMILSEKDGKSNLSFLKYNSLGDVNDETIKMYENVTGEGLGSGPLMLQEHFCRDRETKGAFFVFQNGGAVDVDGLSLKKTIAIENLFVGSVLPAGAIFRGGSFMNFVDVLVDQNGKLYSRIKSTKSLFHSNYFFANPLKYEERELADCHIVRGVYDGIKLSVGYDDQNKRFFVICDGGTSNISDLIDAGKIVMMPDKPKKSPVDYIPLDDFTGYEILSASYFRPSSYSRLGIALLFKKIDSGDCFYQEFTFSRSGTRLTLAEPLFAKVNGVVEPTSNVFTLPYNLTRYTFFGNGKNLCMYYKSEKDEVEIYKTFDSKIVAINGEVYNNKQLCVALEDGSIWVLNVEDAKNKIGKEVVICSVPANDELGRIVDVRFKIGSGNSW